MTYFKSLSSLYALVALVTVNVASAQSDMMMDDSMMMNGWLMVFCLALGIMLFIVLLLAILALLKYLLKK